MGHMLTDYVKAFYLFKHNPTVYIRRITNTNSKAIRNYYL